jgi:selenocysteine lyase/cysteine desulfurase
VLRGLSLTKQEIVYRAGSYGSAPKPVVDSFLAIRDKIDRAPDRFMRLEYEEQLITLRSRLAELVDCDTDDLVIVPSATMGVNVALQSMTNEWQEGDRLLYFNTTM